MTGRCQQDEVYAAQEVLGPGLVFKTLLEADEYLEQRLVGSDWWEARFPRVKDIELHSRQGGKFNGVSTWYEDTWIGHVELSPDGRTERTLLHEVAHACAIARARAQGAWSSVRRDLPRADIQADGQRSVDRATRLDAQERGGVVNDMIEVRDAKTRIPISLALGMAPPDGCDHVHRILRHRFTDAQHEEFWQLELLHDGEESPNGRIAAAFYPADINGMADAITQLAVLHSRAAEA